MCQRQSRNVPVGFAPGTTFYVSTACHVVYNQEEAERTDVWFFFTDDHDQSKVVKAQGVRHTLQSIAGDKSVLLCQVKDLETGLKIWSMFGQSKSQISFPPNYTISYTISCPHGMALRASFGNLMKVREGDSHNPDVKRFKLFINNIPVSCHIEEKKAAYFSCMRNVAMDEPRVSLLPVSDPVGEVLQHLETKGLVVRPTVSEMLILKKAWWDMCAYINAEMRSELKSQGHSEAQITSIFAVDDAQFRSLDDQIVCRHIKDKDVSRDFKQRYQELSDQIDYKMGALERSGEILNSDLVTSIKTMRYSIPTCAGSSGSDIRSIVVKDGRMRQYMATHSRGYTSVHGSSRGNRSGSGIVVEDVLKLKSIYIQSTNNL